MRANRQQSQQFNREQRISDSQNRERQLLHGVPRDNDTNTNSEPKDDNPYGDTRRKPLRKNEKTDEEKQKEKEEKEAKKEAKKKEKEEKEKEKQKQKEEEEKEKEKEEEEEADDLTAKSAAPTSHTDTKTSKPSKKSSRPIKRNSSLLFANPIFDTDSDASDGDLVPWVPPEKSSAKEVHDSISDDKVSVSKEIPANRRVSKRKTDDETAVPQPMAKKVKSTGVTDSAFPPAQQPHDSTSIAQSPPAKKGKGRAKRPSEDGDESKIVKKAKKGSNAASSKAPATSKSSSPVAQLTKKTAASAVTTVAASEPTVNSAAFETAHSSTAIANTVSAVTTVAVTEPIVGTKLRETDGNGNTLSYRVLRRDYALGTIPEDGTWYIVHSPAIPTMQEALDIISAEFPDDGDIRGMIQETDSDGTPTWTYVTHSWAMQLKLETTIIDAARRPLPTPSASTPLRSCFVARMLTTTHPAAGGPARAISQSTFRFLGEFATLAAANDAAMRAALLVKWPAGGAHNADAIAAFTAGVRASTAAGQLLHVEAVDHRGADVEVEVRASRVPAAVQGVVGVAAVADETSNAASHEHEAGASMADGEEESGATAADEASDVASHEHEAGASQGDGEEEEIIVISSDEESDVSSDESEDGAANGNGEEDGVDEDEELEEMLEEAAQYIRTLNDDEVRDGMEAFLDSILELE